ncbi:MULTISPECIES: HGxxPAAW family protein [Streptomyces]|uniref:HGxxPAAW family protein n=1 Tax=Streptomyces TaxID=1883 RepID=UPI0004CD1997|nr:HGxxPAAW family protein [Streptomyces durhamensis]
MSLYDEGHTIAGWTGFGVATVGGGVAGVGVCTASLPVVAGGLAVTGASVLVTWFLHLAGWGKPPGVRPRGQWRMRVRDTQAREGHTGCVGCRLAGRGRARGAVAAAAATAAEAAALSPAE